MTKHRELEGCDWEELLDRRRIEVEAFHERARVDPIGDGHAWGVCPECGAAPPPYPRVIWWALGVALAACAAAVWWPV